MEQKNKTRESINESSATKTKITFETFTCNAVTGEGQQVGMLESREVNEGGHGVIRINVSGLFQDLDCHVEVPG